MPVFEYRGLDKSGKNVRGTVDADSARTARAKLKKDNVYVVDLKDKSRQENRARRREVSSSAGVSVQDMALMTRQLATLIKSNIPLVDALAALTEQVESATLSTALADIKNQVNEGSSLHKALSKYPKIFTNIYVSMCEAGEMSGTLDVILTRLAEFSESQNELNAKIRSAMMYPILMTVFTSILMFVVFIYVIPKVTDIFQQSNMTLPWYTLAVIGISDIIRDYWWLIIGGAFMFSVLFRNWKNTPDGTAQWDTFILKLPLIGPLARMIAVSRFTRTLSTLLAGGVPMLNAMDIVKNVVGNTVLSTAIVEARNNISEGETIAGPLKKSGEFPPIVIHMINIGEKTGELEFMLGQVSESYDFQVKNRVQGLTSVIEPVMIIVMGVAVGGIVFSIMMPIFQMSSAANF
jgi:general secretion pathway protein F